MSRKGKIARLPHAIREELNRRLLEGQAAGKLLPWLNGLPDVQAILGEDFEGLDVNDQNLSEWRKGGYAEWLRRRERLDHTRELSRLSVDLAKAGGGNLADGAAGILAGRLMDILEQLDELTEGAEGASGILPESSDGGTSGK